MRSSGGSSFAFWEHAVACAVSLALTLGFNVAAIALCAAFSAAVFPTSARHEADLLTYGDLGLVAGGNNNNSFSASYGDVVAAAERLGYSHRDIVSGAGHDACLINRVAPTAMIMCPCVGGLSHNEAEEISQEWAAAGTDVLFHAVLETAGIVDD